MERGTRAAHCPLPRTLGGSLASATHDRRPTHRLAGSGGGGPLGWHRDRGAGGGRRLPGMDPVRRGRAPGDPGRGQDGPVDPPGARAARYAGRPWDSRGGGAAASHGLAGAPRSRGPRIRPAVRSGPRPHRAPLPAPPRPQRDRVPRDGSGGGRAVRSSRGAVSGSGVSGERGRAAARAGSRLWRDGASGGGGVAQRVPPPRNRGSPCPDRPAVRHGAPPPPVSFLPPLALLGVAAAATGDRLWLMLSDGVARAGSRDGLLATVDSVVPGWRRLDLTEAVARATRLVNAEPLPGREVAVVSDLQRTTLGQGRADIPRGVRVLALAPRSSGEALANRGVAQARVADGALAITVAGTPGGTPASVTVRLRPAGGPAGRSRDVGRALAAPGSSASVPLPSVAPGWWIGEAVLDPDELRADDRRAFVWRVALPGRAAARPGAGPLAAAALAVLTQGRRIVEGGGVVIGERLPGGTGTTVLLPPVDPALIGQANRALASRGVRWRFGGAGTPGPIGTAAVAGINGLGVTRRYRLEGAGGGGDTTDVLATVNDDPWLVRAGGRGLLGRRLDTARPALPPSPALVPFVYVVAIQPA